MNTEVLKSKTTIASVLLLALSGVRVAMGDVTGIQGVQEAIAALIPIFLRAAISSGAEKTAVAAQQAVAEAAQPARVVVGPAAGEQ